MEHHRYITFYCQIAKILSCDRGLIYTLVSEIFEKYCIVCITVIFQSLEKKKFAGSSVVKTGHFHCPGPGSIPGQGTKIPKAMWHWTKKKKKKKPGKYYLLGFPGGSVLEKPGDSGSIPGSGWTYELAHTATEAQAARACALQREATAVRSRRSLQLEKACAQP